MWEEHSSSRVVIDKGINQNCRWRVQFGWNFANPAMKWYLKVTMDFLLNCLGACLEGLVGSQACCCISSPWLRWGICYPWCEFLDLYLFLKICVEFCGGGYMFRWDFSIQWFGQDFIGVLIVNNHDILVTLNYGYQEMPHMITEELSC